MLRLHRDRFEHDEVVKKMSGDQGTCRELLELFPPSPTPTRVASPLRSGPSFNPSSDTQTRPSRICRRRGHLPLSTAHRLVHELGHGRTLATGGERPIHHRHHGIARLGRGRQSAPDAQARIGEVLDDLALVTGQRARFGVLCGHASGSFLPAAPRDGGHSSTAGTPAGACHCGWQSSSCPCPAGLSIASCNAGLWPTRPTPRRAKSGFARKCLTTLKRGVAISQGEWHDAKLAVATPVFGPSGLCDLAH